MCADLSSAAPSSSSVLSDERTRRLKPGLRVVVRAVPPYKPGKFEGRTGVLVKRIVAGSLRVLFDEPEQCSECKGTGLVPAVHEFGAQIVHPADLLFEEVS